ncbi:MAG: type III toxin-antitoxin system ToxN/AbiQ family toxin [Oscillospiraceae bacterium]|jgi:protein AbiQ|nr:type III toxin-antitoxin system ToxN/AbiQ family toxin [Oscillospiraceae bacterium]
MSKLMFYEVDREYIEFLTHVDDKVPKIDYSVTGGHEKFLCGIVLAVNGFNYFAPISSFNIPQRTNYIILSESGKAVSSIRFSFMIPIPPGVAAVKNIAAEPSIQYRRLLEQEWRFCVKNSDEIHRRARAIYNIVVNRENEFISKNCCDFKALEAACAEYAKAHPAKEQPATELGKPSVHDAILADREAKRNQPPKPPAPDKGKDDPAR